MTVKVDNCVAADLFYEKLELLKSPRKGKASNLTVFINGEIYGRVKARLTAENQSQDIEGLSTIKVATILERKK